MCVGARIFLGSPVGSAVSATLVLGSIIFVRWGIFWPAPSLESNSLMLSHKIQSTHKKSKLPLFKTMKQAIKRESSWGVLDTEGASSDNTVAKSAKQSISNLSTLEEEGSTTSLGPPKMEESSTFQAMQITPNPSNPKTKTSSRESMTKMSSWACLDLDDLWMNLWKNVSF